MDRHGHDNELLNWNMEVSMNGYVLGSKECWNVCVTAIITTVLCHSVSMFEQMWHTNALSYNPINIVVSVCITFGYLEGSYVHGRMI